MPLPEVRKGLLWEDEEEEGSLGHFLEKKWLSLILPRPHMALLFLVLAPLVLITTKAEPRLPEQPLASSCCLLRGFAAFFSQRNNFLWLCRGFGGGFALAKGGFSLGRCQAGFS